MANSSGELKGYLNNTNFSLVADCRAGDDQPFYTERIGTARLMHNGITYYTNSWLGARAEHVVYVPDNTGDSANELIAAAEKRIGDYIGYNKISIVKGEKTLTEYKADKVSSAQAIIDELQPKYDTYDETHRNTSKISNAQFLKNEYEYTKNNYENQNNEWRNQINARLSEPNGATVYASEIAMLQHNISQSEQLIQTYEQQIQEQQAIIDAENLKPEYNHFEYNQMQWAIQGAQSEVLRYTGKFNQEDELAFMNDAAGDYLFSITVNGEARDFVIIKDSAKLTVPTYASQDLNTNVQVKTDSSEIPLDTMISVEKLTQGTEYDRIIKAIGTEDNEMFNITLYSDSSGEYITKLENGKFEVKLPVPEKFNDKELMVYYVDADNKVTEHKVTVKDGFAIFATDHFSIYTLSVAKTVTNPIPIIPNSVAPQTNDNSN